MNVLMVEDSATDSELLARMISDALPEAKIDRVPRLADAVRQLDSAHYDVVLLDLSLPDSQGLDAVRRLAADDGLAVLVLTGQDDSDLALEALKAGAQDYLWKNEVEPRILSRCIRYAIERKQGDQAIREKDAQLLQKQRIEALGELAGGVAHEFNNLIQIIQTYGSFAIEELPRDDRRFKDLKEILSAADRAARLTAQLLGFSRRRSLQRSLVETNAVVAELIQMLRPLLGEHIQVGLELDERVGSLDVDTALFEQMLTNICLNSRDALPHGGEIKVSTQPIVMTDCDELHSELQPGPYIAISVTDNGLGMTDDVLAKIFDPFFTTKDVGKGTGLGLSMVYGVAKQHNGAVKVYSEPGIGTTIRIYLPAADPHARINCPAFAEPHMAGGNEIVLIAEDEPGVRRAAQRILERAGYSILCAADGVEAVRVFEANSEQISAVVLDAIMPKLMGRHVYEAIRSIKPDAPVLFCTGFDRETGLFDFVSREGLSILTKPFQPADLLEAVRRVIDQPRPLRCREPANAFAESEVEDFLEELNLVYS